MTVTEQITGLKARFGAPYSPSDKKLIEKLYLKVLGRVFAPTSCQNCYHDAVIELYLYYVKNRQPMANEKKFILKAGAIICTPQLDNGKVYSNANLTDDVAARYLAMFPGRANLFAKFETPKAESKKAEKTPTRAKRGKGGTTTRKQDKTPSDGE